MANLKYGNTIRLNNAYGLDSNKDAYLGTNTGAPVPDGATTAVGAYPDTKKDEETKWIVAPAANSGKQDGQPVASGDLITLQNVKDQSYLALFYGSAPSSAGYPVDTATATDDTITISWYILVTSDHTTNDADVRDGDNLLLVAPFGALSGVLDTNGVGKYGFQYSVTGARLVNRDGGSGKWVLKILVD
ncbi:hypothetical protein [Burkholderia gladioli]|uniref:hypothetical protein n=1 Tax=Burkholderia gladioli TaxID=28095 RepID=UPI000CFF9EF6|nr:hypothetical protein [Burkholderia gladioli]MBU9276777.1 hypothetical protein [Burkholderia gladioli]MDN7466314.1 hypothetical protein [Burkholderia gladioli]MDN7812819.1 hypothetical protein [Burkholderia gladioli]PRE10669.1 hypothetical protein C6P72_34060 [Burkholderia gladioli]PRG56277.1 hypothetical protein C6V06_05350 [Burkholderia gladioli]